MAVVVGAVPFLAAPTLAGKKQNAQNGRYDHPG